MEAIAGETLDGAIQLFLAERWQAWGRKGQVAAARAGAAVLLLASGGGVFLGAACSSLVPDRHVEKTYKVVCPNRAPQLRLVAKAVVNISTSDGELKRRSWELQCVGAQGTLPPTDVQETDSINDVTG